MNTNQTWQERMQNVETSNGQPVALTLGRPTSDSRDQSNETRADCPGCGRNKGHGAYCRANDEPSRIAYNLSIGERTL